jgi:phage FluMu protein Com
MMQIRCQRCGWNFTLSRDAIGLAVAELEQAHADYSQFNCPRCRHVVKVPGSELRRRLPADYVLPVVPPKPEPVVVHKEESEPAP